MNTIPKITLKRCKNDDWQIVEKMEKVAKSRLFSPFEGEKKIKEYIRKSEVYMILKGDDPIGTVSYEVKKDGHILFNGLVVLPKYRKRGIGSTAIQKALKRAGNRKAELIVHPENTVALIIYLKLGFKIKSWKDNYFGDGESRLILWKD